jgi:hypothetical protein
MQENQNIVKGSNRHFRDKAPLKLKQLKDKKLKNILKKSEKSFKNSLKSAEKNKLLLSHEESNPVQIFSLYLII